MNARPSLFLTGFLFLAACSSQPAAITPAPQTEPAASEVVRPATSSARSWRITPDSASHRYQAMTMTTLALADVRDSARLQMVLSVALQPGNEGITINGSVDSVTSITGSKIGGGTSSVSLGSFHGQLDNAVLSVDSRLSREGSACSQTGLEVAPVLVRLITRLPSELRAGMVWTDSMTTTTCIGNIPGTLKYLRSYRVEGEASFAGANAIVITRTDHATSSAEGAQDQHSVKISSTGTGSTQLFVNPVDGSLLHSTNDYTGSVTVEASGRRQVFGQTVHELITEQQRNR